jgi:hypothetical protein
MSKLNFNTALYFYVEVWREKKEKNGHTFNSSSVEVQRKIQKNYALSFNGKKIMLCSSFSIITVARYKFYVVFACSSKNAVRGL